MTRYVIRRVDDKQYWEGLNMWSAESWNAWSFPTLTEAYLRGLSDCPVDSSLWTVEPVPDQGQAEEAVS